jgi:hypothetical protein
MVIRGNCRTLWTVLLCSSVILAGCFGEGTDEVTFDEEDVLLSDGLTSVDVEGGSAVDRGPASEQILSGLTEPKRHSLVKRVTQTLSQSSPDGLETSEAELQSWFDVVATKTGDGETSYRVTYQRIQYSHKLPGESLTYDSAEPEVNVPGTLIHLSDLSRRGFSFRTTGGGTSMELVDVPSTVYSGELTGTGASDFVSDQIGMVLLGVASGRQSTAPSPRIRHVATPVPLDMSTRYSVKGTAEGSITLDMLGSVMSASSPTRIQLAGVSVSVQLGGGHAFGEMTIDTSSSVPVRADWNCYIEISMRTESGDRIDQRKHEMMMIRAAKSAPKATSVGRTSLHRSEPPLLQPVDATP